MSLLRKLFWLAVLYFFATVASAGPKKTPEELRIERITAEVSRTDPFGLLPPVVISKVEVVDYHGVTSAAAGCPPVGQARAYYDSVANTFKVVDSSCALILNGGGSGAVQWNQLLNPNGNLSPDFGNTVFTFSNGTWDWGNFTVNLPHAASLLPTSEGQIAYDTTSKNLLFFGDASSILGRFDSSATLSDGSLVGISLTASEVKLTPIPSNSDSGTSPIQITVTNPTLGDTGCITDLGPPLTWDNCTPGVPVNLQTSDYTIDPVNDRGTAVVSNDANNSTVTFNQQISDATDMDASWFDFHFDKGTGAVAFTLTAPSTFDSTGTQSETILTGEQCSVLTDTTGDGTAYLKCHEPRILAGNGISLTRSPYFLQISANPSAPANNGLITGGGVSWTSGLTFEVGAATYSIAGAIYTTAETPVTLGAADPSNPRIDVIAVNASSAVVVIAGTAAPNPSAPSIDPTSQLSLTFVTVPAASSTPVVSQTVIYRNNAGSPTEWNCTSTANLNCNSTTNPFGGTTHSLEATTAVATNSATLTIGSGSVNLAQSQTLVFFIRNKATWANAKNLQIFWRNGTTNVGTAVTFRNGVYGFDQTNTTTYQQIAIPLTAFQTGVAPVTNLRFQVNGGGGSIGFYLGNILLQTGFSGGGGSGGGGSFQLQVNGNPGQSTQSLDDNASVTFTQTLTNGVTHVTATAIGAPPSGTAGGALAGTYPNPTLANGTSCTNQVVSAISQSTAAGTCHTVVGADMASATVTSTQLAAQYSKLRCETGLGDGLNAMTAGTYLQFFCVNTSGVTWTITGINCWTDNAGTSTLNATNNAGTGLLTGAVTCNNTKSGGGAAGTQSGTVTLANNDAISFTFVADGTSKQTTWTVSMTQ